MSITLEIPELGDGDIEGTAINIQCAPGDTVEQDQVLLEVETDKVVVEIPAAHAGIVEQILISDGDTVTKGTPFIRLVNSSDQPANDKQVAPTTSSTSSGNSAEPITFTLPELGDGDIEGTVINFDRTVGSTVQEGETLLEIETDKVVVEIPAEKTGVVETLLVANGSTVKKGTPYITLLCDAPQTQQPVSVQKASNTEDKPDTDPAPVVKATPTQMPESVKAEPANSDIIPAGPASRRLARQLGINIADVRGSGPRGRINKSDVKATVKARLQQQSASTGAHNSVAAAPALPDIAQFGEVRRESMSRIQQATAANMVRSSQIIPHAWIEEKIDITAIEASRQKLKDRVKAQGGTLTMTTFLVKAVANALKQFPVINCCIDTENGEIIYRQYINIGVAADTPRGLLVPVIRNVESRSITDVGIELAELSNQARNGALSADALKGGGFTISNLGGIGVTSMNPVVNWPEVAILGVARAEWEPRLQNGEFVPRLMLPVTLGFDHRIVNGADAARFLQSVREQLEDTACLALNC